MTTVAERLEAKGRAEGEAKERAEGEAKGRAEALLRIMRLHFQEDPDPDTVAVIRSASVEQLDRWIDRVFSVEAPRGVIAE